MKYTVGDKVKFLNQEGGGIISKIVSPDMVNVAIEDGFEIPTLIRDLVRIEDDSPAGRYFGAHYQVEVSDFPHIQSTPKKRTAPTPVNQPPAPATGLSRAVSSRKRSISSTGGQGLRKGIYLAFVPDDQKSLISGGLNIYLINYSGYDLLFSLFLKESKVGYAGKDYAVLDEYTHIHLDYIAREEINNWSAGIVQALFYKSHQDQVLSPLTAAFRIQGVRLYKEDNYQPVGFFNQRAFLFLLGEIAHQAPVTPEQKDQPEPPPKKMVVSQPVRKKELIEKHAIAKDIAEVDLHISALKSDFSAMTNTEILHFQMEYFHRSLDNAIAKAYRKVIFIHGIGNGVLRDGIIDYLKRNFPDFVYRNASFQTYGYGALEVELSD
ncbi:MAG: DUF2027 domain-containing protein [Bacteroidales bacterium]|nr:DUF2027 domain-containing protein [Bacteroidales bacterium]MDD2323593.1 DUF2027 domain-containing protein [Bacteroidales bacterium]MDD3960273.1 DUF2027 domain-containing protein [Bacteroidales bacterium]MDY0284777.1 DUF2027 domain-containing protein [Bacteroidales bacterium]